MNTVAPRACLGRWWYSGQSCANVPFIEELEHAHLLRHMHDGHGHTCMVYVAALGYETVVMA